MLGLIGFDQIRKNIETLRIFGSRLGLFHKIALDVGEG